MCVPEKEDKRERKVIASGLKGGGGNGSRKEEVQMMELGECCWKKTGITARTRGKRNDDANNGP